MVTSRGRCSISLGVKEELNTEGEGGAVQGIAILDFRGTAEQGEDEQHENPGSSAVCNAPAPEVCGAGKVVFDE